MKNKSFKNKLLQYAVKMLVDKETREWPPQCLGFYYQPSRPLTKEANKSMRKKSNHSILNCVNDPSEF